MYFIDHYKELEGKTIGLFEVEQFTEHIVIGTTDGGIMVIDFEYDDENYGTQIKVRGKGQAEHFIFKRLAAKRIVENLHKKGIITAGEYEQFCHDRQAEEEAKKQERVIKREERDRQEYARLKAKYKND